MSPSASASEPSPRPRFARYRLEVTGGPRRGAGECLETDTARTLGSALESDIVLCDPRVDELALVFDTGADGTLVIEVRGGELRRDGAPLDGAGPHPHVEGAVYGIGATLFTLTPEGPAAEGAPSGAPHGGRADDGDGAEATDAAEEPGSPWPPVLLFGVAACLCLAIGVSWALHRSSAAAVSVATAEAAAAAEASPGVEARLREAGFESLVLVGAGVGAGPDAAPRVTGYVASRRRLTELRALLREVRPQPGLDVHVQSDIVEGVRDVYRTNGIEATVESAGTGAVRVLTAEREPPDADAMRTAAMEDVAGLITLETRNDPPPPEPSVPSSSPVVPPPEAPGKRVVAVVRGAPSYVVTEDESRYFVGARLPTGHTIAAIDERSVMLELQGRRTRLKF